MPGDAEHGLVLGAGVDLAHVGEVPQRVLVREQRPERGRGDVDDADRGAVQVVFIPLRGEPRPGDVIAGMRCDKLAGGHRGRADGIGRVLCVLWFQQLGLAVGERGVGAEHQQREPRRPLHVVGEHVALPGQVALGEDDLREELAEVAAGARRREDREHVLGRQREARAGDRERLRHRVALVDLLRRVYVLGGVEDVVPGAERGNRGVVEPQVAGRQRAPVGGSHAVPAKGEPASGSSGIPAVEAGTGPCGPA